MSESGSAKCACRHCDTHLEFPLELAGTEIPCPRCGQATPLFLPETDGTADRGPGPLEEILAGFTRPIPRTRVSFVYKLGLVLVAGVMVLLPLVYVGIVGLVAWFLFRFAQVAWAGTGGIGLLRSSWIGVLLGGGVMVAGIATLLFLLRPLFARRAPRAQPLALNPEIEPALFAFIAKVCDSVGAPMPVRVDLDCRLNASAGFRRGALSFLGNDLVLTLGAPLIAGLNLRQFAGVLAHEFGHFTQGAGMRLFYIVRSINDWFTRLVYERDAWDLELEDWAAEAENALAAFVVGCSRFGVGLARLVLRVPMYLGHGVSGLLSRAMEYDADHYEIHLAGSAAFASTLQRLHVLGRASKRAYDVVGVMWKREHRLPENLPLFLLQQEAQLTGYIRTKVDLEFAQARTGLFDTHPACSDRVRRARAMNVPGVFALEIPATSLFGAFEALARQITWMHYTEDLRLPVVPAVLTSTR